MKVLEVTDPNFVVNKDFSFIVDGVEVPFYEDDYLDVKPYKGKLIINNKYIVEDPSFNEKVFDDYIELVDPTYKIEEATVDESKLTEAKIVLK